jgi:hypothetical protein
LLVQFLASATQVEDTQYWNESQSLSVMQDAILLTAANELLDEVDAHAELLSPTTPTNPLKQLPQVLAVELHLFLCRTVQLGARLQATELSEAPQEAIACLDWSTVPPALEEIWDAIKDCSDP